MAPMTPTKTTVAIQNTIQKSSSMRSALGPAGSKVVRGWAPVSNTEQDASNRAVPARAIVRVKR